MADMTETDVRTGKRKSTDEEVHSHIGSRLKAYYDRVLTEPVPDRFENLLRQLDAQSASQNGQEQS